MPGVDPDTDTLAGVCARGDFGISCMAVHGWPWPRTAVANLRNTRVVLSRGVLQGG